MAATNDEALVRALEDLPGWRRHGDSIWKTYQFDDFASATLFVGGWPTRPRPPATSPTWPSAAGG